MTKAKPEEIYFDLKPDDAINGKDKLFTSNIRYLKHEIDGLKADIKKNRCKETSKRSKRIYMGYLIETLEILGFDDSQIKDIIEELNEVMKNSTPEEALSIYYDFLEYNFD